MRSYPQLLEIPILVAMVVGVLIITATPARAHCDTEDGHAGDCVAAGRAYVAAYVEFVHYAERLHQAVVTPAHAHGKEHASVEPPSEHVH